MHFLKIGSGAVLALTPSMALASTAAPDIIVTATGAETPRAAIGQAISVLTAEDLKTRQTVAIADILASVPGVTLSRNGPIGGFTAIRLRGAEGEQTLALIDGVKVNDPSAPGGGFDFGTLLATNINRIEVLRGPNSVPWGSEAIGGVVNIQTARPSTGLAGSGRAEYGTADQAHLVGSLSGGTETVRAQLGGGWFTDRGLSAYRYGTEADGLRQYAINGRVEADLTAKLSLDLRGWYAHSRILQDGYAPPTYAFGDTRDLTLATQSIGYAGLIHRGAALQSRLAVTVSDMNRDAFATPEDSAPQYVNHGRINRVDYKGDWSLARGIRAIFGAEHEQSRTHDGYSSQKTHVTSSYAQLMADLSDQITLVGGLRLDDHASFGTHVTSSASLSWRPSNTTVVRAAFGEGFKAPTLFQLYSYYGNAALQPETANSYDLGIEHSLFNGRLKLSATAFLRDSRNQIIFYACGCHGRPDGTYENIGKTRAKGVETSVDVRPWDNVNLMLSYTRLSTENRVTGAALPRRPKNSLYADLDWQSPWSVQLGANLRWVSSSLDTDFQTYSPVQLQGYALMGLRAALPLTQRIELYGRIENLFDTQYETVSGYGSYGRTAHIGVRVGF